MIRSGNSILLSTMELYALVKDWGNKFFADAADVNTGKLPASLQLRRMGWTDGVYVTPFSDGSAGVAVEVITDTEDPEQLAVVEKKCAELFEHFANSVEYHRWSIPAEMQSGDPDWFEDWVYESHLHGEPGETVAYLPYQLIGPLLSEELGLDFTIRNIDTRSDFGGRMCILSEEKWSEVSAPTGAKQCMDEEIQRRMFLMRQDRKKRQNYGNGVEN